MRVLVYEPATRTQARGFLVDVLDAPPSEVRSVLLGRRSHVRVLKPLPFGAGFLYNSVETDVLVARQYVQKSLGRYLVYATAEEHQHVPELLEELAKPCQNPD